MIWTIDALRTDLKQAWRATTRRPGGTIALVLVLGLGVGLTSAMFALADPFLFRPLPFADPESLVVVQVSPEAARALTRGISLPTFDEWRRRTDLFTGLAAWRTDSGVRVRTSDGTSMLTTVQATEDFFTVLGIQPAGLAAWKMSAHNRDDVVALTPRGRRSAGGPGLTVGDWLDRSDGPDAQIAALLPTDFLFPNIGIAREIDALFPFEAGAVADIRVWNDDGSPAVYSYLNMLGRLAPGVTAGQVSAGLAWSVDSKRTISVSVEPLTEVMTRSVRPLARGALAAGLLILLVCAGNVANLLIVRNSFRRRDHATRVALGASRATLARLAFFEFGLIEGTGIIVGLVMAAVVTAVVRSVIPYEFASLGNPSVSWRVVAFVAATGLAVSIIGAGPAWLVQRVRPVALFGRTRTRDAPGVRSLRFAMAAVQSAVAVVLAIGATLLVHSYSNLTGQHVGIDSDVLVISAWYPDADTTVKLQADIDATIEGIQRLPGVQMVAASEGSMLNSVRSSVGLTIDGRRIFANKKAVTTNFFETTGLRIREGMGLGTEDREVGAIVVSRSFARRYWPNSVAVGKTAGLGGSTIRVVGVTDDVFDVALDAEPMPTVYLPLHDPSVGFAISYLIRSNESSASLRDPVNRVLLAVNRDMVIRGFSTVGERLSDSVRNRIFATLILSLFAIAGLAVSSAGLIGVVTFLVARRTREIAIRVAVGAGRSSIRWLVIREAVTAAIVGALAGLVVGHWLAKSLEALLYGLEPGSWGTPSAAAALTVLLMGLAAVIPAQHALRIQPIEALLVD